MKKEVRITSLMLSALLVSTSFAGCSGKSDSGKNAAATSKPDQNPTEISVFFDNPRAGLDRSNTPVLKEIEKRTNTKIKITEAPSGQGTEKLNLLIASGDIPDVMRIDSNLKLINMYGTQGAIQSIDEIADKYMPNFKKAVNKDALDKMKASDNKVYAVPSIRDTGYNGFFVRKDWMTKLNLSEPKTTDEYYNLLKAFTEKDPDGNGKNDTIGTSMIENLQWFELVSGPFGLPLNEWMKADDGSLVFSAVNPKMKDALAFAIKLYKDGVMDKEFGTMKRTQFDEKASNSRIGLIDSTSSAAAKLETTLQKTVPDAKFVALQNIPVAPGIKKGIACSSNIIEGTNGKSFTSFSAISKKTKNLEKVAKFLDGFFTDDMSTLQTFGLEGTNYSLENNVPKYKPDYAGQSKSESRTKDGVWDCYLFGGVIDQKTNAWAQVFPADTIKYMSASVENTLPKIVNFSTPTGDSAASEIDKTQKEYFTKIIMGGVSLDDGWNQWLKEFDRLGGTKWTKEINDVYKTRK